VWLVGTFASGAALAAVIPLSLITPGPTSFRGIGAAVTPGVAFDDKFAFDVVGTDGKFGGSLASAQIAPDGTDGLFDLTAQLFKWDPAAQSFVAVTGMGTGPILFFDTGVVVPVAVGGDTSPNGINHAYYLEVSGIAPLTLSGKVSSYGGSIILAAVPEPASILFLVGGMILVIVATKPRRFAVKC